jgi:acetyl-CoA acetyltransferase
MGLRGDAAIVGYSEWPSRRRWTGPRELGLAQWARIAREALEDAGLPAASINGIACAGVPEAPTFAPATLAEYLGTPVGFAERLDLGGATPVGMIWRAAAAIELGIADVVVCAVPFIPAPPRPAAVAEDRPYAEMGFGQASAEWGSPQAEFDIPYGNVAQNCGYALIAQRYAAEFGYDPRALAKIAVDQRRSALRNPDAVFCDQPISIDDVLASRMIADPLHLLEIVMPTSGGAAVVVASRERARGCRHRPVWITGFGEHLAIKTPTYAQDMLRTPIGPAARQAFAMAGVDRSEVDLVSLYDCYTITVLLSLEDAGFCAKGEGLRFVREHDLSYAGDFPCNTHGGQLGFGQPGLAGGMSHPVEAARQIMGRAGERQLRRADLAFVSGTGGVMSEQAALVLRGD